MSEGEGKRKDERVKREKIGRGRIAVALILTFLPFYGLPRRLLVEVSLKLKMFSKTSFILNDTRVRVL